MTKEFLQRYNFTEERFLAWVKSQGSDPQDAVAILFSYAKECKDFRSGDDFCIQLMADVHKLEMDRLFYATVAKEEQKKVEEQIPPDTRSRLRKIWDLIIGR